MSAALNSKIDNRSSSVSAGALNPERVAGNESGVPLTQVLQDVESVCGSNATDFMALEGMIYFGTEVLAATGSISWVCSDDRFKSCSSERRGAIAAVSNPSKIKSPRISAT